MSLFIEILEYIVVFAIAIRTTSYAIWSIKDKNVLGGIMLCTLSLCAVVFLIITTVVTYY
ncbi:MAG: hypothetical protein Q8882_07675 [Bacillota bacterium]|nr:hypothetical protein [Bacillota bacterium]